MSCCRDVPKIWPRFLAGCSFLNEQHAGALHIQPNMHCSVPVPCKSSLQVHFSMKTCVHNASERVLDMNTVSVNMVSRFDDACLCTDLVQHVKILGGRSSGRRHCKRCRSGHASPLLTNALPDAHTSSVYIGCVVQHNCLSRVQCKQNPFEHLCWMQVQQRGGLKDCLNAEPQVGICAAWLHDVPTLNPLTNIVMTKPFSRILVEEDQEHRSGPGLPICRRLCAAICLKFILYRRSGLQQLRSRDVALNVRLVTSDAAAVYTVDTATLTFQRNTATL